MTTVIPQELPATIDVESTNAWSHLDAPVLMVPCGRGHAAGFLAGSLLNATCIARVRTDNLALLLSEFHLHGRPGGGESRTGTLEIDDLRPFLVGTSFITINYDNLLGDPFRGTDTRMNELHMLAPGLSLRQWADLFGVSKQAIRNWMADEPRNRPELDAALRALRAAAVRQPDLAGWLQAPLPGSTRTPLQLARDGRWRALTAASRMAAPVGAGVAPTHDMRENARERRALAKLLGGADAPPAADGED